jgi:hypothetical protein
MKQSLIALTTLALLAVSSVLSVTCLSAQEVGAATSGSIGMGSNVKLRFQLSAGTALLDGYTEYEIDAGSLPLGSPDGPIVPFRSRLRFPVNSTLGLFSVSAEYRRFILSARLGIQFANEKGLFKDYDWYELSGSQKTWVIGKAQSDDQTSLFEADAGIRIDAGGLSVTPRLRLKYVKMEFVEQGLEQINYYVIDTVTVNSFFYAWLTRLDEPVTTTLGKSTEVLRYEVEYKTLYAGATVAYAFPFGLDAEVTVLGSPVARVDDLDNHLIRNPPKDTRISASNGTAGLLDLQLTYRIEGTVSLWAGFTYEFVTASGQQEQTFLDDPPVTYRNIDASVKAEWSSIRGGISIALSPGG